MAGLQALCNLQFRDNNIAPQCASITHQDISLFVMIEHFHQQLSRSCDLYFLQRTGDRCMLQVYHRNSVMSKALYYFEAVSNTGLEADDFMLCVQQVHTGNHLQNTFQIFRFLYQDTRIEVKESLKTLASSFCLLHISCFK